MRILMPTDGSSYGERALRFGALVASSAQQPVVVLGIAAHQGECDRVQQALTRAEERLRKQGIDLRTKLRVGQAEEQILQETEEHQYDLLIVGSRRRGRVTRFFSGSRASRLASQCPVPVLIVRGKRDSLREMLICTGAGKASEESIRFGARVAKATGARATLLHVMSQLLLTPEAPTADWELATEEFLRSEAREALHLRQGLKMLQEARVAARGKTRRGLVVHEIFAEAKEGDYDLIVVGAHAARGLDTYLLDNVANQIVTRARRPVLVVRPPVEEQ